MSAITVPCQLLYGFLPRRERRTRIRLESEVKNKVHIRAKSENDGQDKVKTGKVSKEKAPNTAENEEQTTSKKPTEPNQDFLAFLETGEISLFKSKHYKVSVSFGLNSLLMCPIVYVSDTGTGLNLINDDVLDQSWLENIRQRDKAEI